MTIIASSSFVYYVFVDSRPSNASIKRIAVFAFSFLLQVFKGISNTAVSRFSSAQMHKASSLYLLSLAFR